MEQVTLELIKGVKDRFKYPIITIYVIVLILWNWDVLSYFFLSESKIEHKIIYIEKHFNQNYSRILWPLVKAIVLAVIVPILMLLIEVLLKSINSLRRNIKFENNDAIRTEKLAIAVHEFKLEQERTGKKTIQEWEEKVNSLQQKLDIIKLDNITIDEEKEQLKNLNKNYIEELVEKKSEVEKLNNRWKSLSSHYENIITQITELNTNRLSNIHDFINKIQSVTNDGIIIFGTEINANDKLIIKEFEQLDIVYKEDGLYYTTILGTTFIEFCKIKFPSSTIEKL